MKKLFLVICFFDGTKRLWLYRIPLAVRQFALVLFSDCNEVNYKAKVMEVELGCLWKHTKHCISDAVTLLALWSTEHSPVIVLFWGVWPLQFSPVQKKLIGHAQDFASA